MPTKKRKKRRKRYSRWRLRLVVTLLAVTSLAAFWAVAAGVYHYYRFSAAIAARLDGRGAAHPALVATRPFELRRGLRLGADELVEVLNAIGYRHRSGPAPVEPGSFDRPDESTVVLVPRRGTAAGRPVRVRFRRLWIEAMEDGERSYASLELERVPLTPLFGAERTKRTWVALESMPPHLVAAVLATEDRRFFDHTGIDPLGILRAAVVDLLAGEIRQGGSTLSQQLVKNEFLGPERSIRRKLLEVFLALILESRATKEQILELYLNEVYLGQRGSFAIAGVGQAARVLFGKDVRNLTVEEAALVAALIRAPNAASPFRSPERARARRNVVLRQMAEAGFLSPEAAAEAEGRPLRLRPGFVDRAEAPYFVDALRERLLDRYEASALLRARLRIDATVDRYLQGAAQKAVVEGLAEVERRLGPRADASAIQAALVALDPHTGDVLALVGGRRYGESQFNRALAARRQPGSAFKPFVYLAAFEEARRRIETGAPAGGIAFAAPSSFVLDVPTTFPFGGRRWTPQNYERRFEGRVTYRQALARSLNVATARVGRDVGFDRVAALWRRLGGGPVPAYPSIALGAFETTPLELARAYAALANGGSLVEPRWYTGVRDETGRLLDAVPVRRRRVLPPAPCYLVVDMMRSVLDEGTGREIRTRGLRADAAGKTGTTNDARDAWFVGFTPDVLAVVWVGYDDHRRLGLTGAKAALPIWTRFMKAAVSGREKRRFAVPPGVRLVAVDPDTGAPATSACPRRRTEPFLEGAVPRDPCPRHPAGARRTSL